MISASRQPLVLNDDTAVLRLLRDRFLNGTQEYLPSHKHMLLTFLAMCNASGVVATPCTQQTLERLNAEDNLVDDRELLQMCKGVLTSSEIDAPMLDYLAALHHSVYIRQNIRQGPFYIDNSNSNLKGTWLGWDCVERSLVIPDVRKLALDLQWRRELRAGEREFVRRVTANTTSSEYGVLQTLRTPEYLSRVRMGIMYGDINVLFRNEWLDTIIIAMIQARMLSRAGLDWIARCVQFSSSARPRNDGQAHVMVERNHIVVSNGTKSFACSHATTMFRHWCELTNSTIDGRYDMSHCTI